MALSDACLPVRLRSWPARSWFWRWPGVLRVGQDVHAFVCSGLVGLCLVVRRLGLVVRGLGPLALGCRVGEDLRGFGGFGLCGLLGLFGGGLRVGGAGLRLVGLVERGLGLIDLLNAASYVDWALRTPLT